MKPSTSRCLSVSSRMLASLVSPVTILNRVWWRSQKKEGAPPQAGSQGTQTGHSTKPWSGRRQPLEIDAIGLLDPHPRALSPVETIGAALAQ